ncbi:MAG TPA: peptidoglycan DD-metalloendopeptidase family protein [Solirubrobacterales bacterium]|jgi:murein DD-endopeptidase MepM/ murein hydrolase activator NlpD|nr:peptidoglycan DD-metalloendopeptidase family protein [Solirubrobacterales bacterium]
MTKPNNRPGPNRRSTLLALCATGVVTGVLAVAGGAPAQDIQAIQNKIDSSRAQLGQKQAQLQHAKDRAGVLSTTIQRYGDRVDQLRGEVATLQNRIAIVETQLQKKEAELKEAKARLVELRAHLKRSLRVLQQRLVDIYESNNPDAMTVILSAHGFNDLLSRYDYLQRIQSQDTSIAVRVKRLRNQEKETVDRVRAARDAIAARQAELERSQADLEARQSSLVDARQKDQQLLSQVQQTQDQLEGDVGDISAQIASQLQAKQEAEAAAAAAAARAAAQQESSTSSGGTSAAPAGPVQGESSSGMIWPVNGPITSPFCEQRAWESCHPGIDISVPSGTPIHAAAAGTVAIAGPESGYGNYTCIDHGGGVSTCYAHQQSISVSVGQHVGQGQVIGYSDCTGLCFGPHLHFEVRVNGNPVDPMGYLP